MNWIAGIYPFQWRRLRVVGVDVTGVRVSEPERNEADSVELLGCIGICSHRSLISTTWKFCSANRLYRTH